MRAWLAAVREQVDDALAAGRDATRAYRKRVLSRHEARRKLVEAEAALAATLALLVRDVLSPTAFATLYAPFAARIPVDGLAGSGNVPA